MKRRDFLGLSLAAVGGIFVPKYEVWYRQAPKLLTPAEALVSVAHEDFIYLAGSKEWVAVRQAVSDFTSTLRERMVVPTLTRVVAEREVPPHLVENARRMLWDFGPRARGRVCRTDAVCAVSRCGVSGPHHRGEVA